MKTKERRESVIRVALAVVLLTILGLLIWQTGRAGFGSLLTTSAAQSNQIGRANAAVALGTGNPDSHYIRATILQPNDPPGAIAEFYEAALGRPDDYVLWLSLARASELNGDTAQAIAAARQAIPLAPDYAEPHYQLGNILLRAGQTVEAFKELRLAATSNPTLLPGIIDLGWRVSGRNVQFVIDVLRPDNVAMYRALGQYFRQQNQVDAAIAMYLAGGTATEPDRRSYMSELINSQRYKEAARLWSVAGLAPGVLSDPGFEQESELDRPGFGWRLGERPEGFRLSLDSNNPNSGQSCLKIEFEGESDPGRPVITQLALVEPGRNYRLRFAARSEALVSGGFPKIAVIEAATNVALGQSEQFPATTDGWREFTVDFATGQSTNAVQITLMRQLCQKSPCPVFGRLWLDSFSLQKI